VRDGVNWKINRLDDTHADLDLIVNEAKTGNASIQLNFGGSETTIASPLSGLSAEFSVSDTNVFGQGIRMKLTGKLGKDEKTVTFNLTEPWLFDKPIFGAFDFYHQRFGFDDFNFTQPVNARHTGGSLTSGFVFTHRNYLMTDTYVRGVVGFEGLGYERRPRAIIPPGDLTPEERILATAEYDFLLAQMFDPGKFVWLKFLFGQDKKNHPMHPSSGYNWNFISHFVVPTSLSNLGFYKLDLDYHWYTPLIGAVDLIFHWHSYFGVVKRFKNRVIPYNELFHIGGPASVRGFLYGQIGPQFTIDNGSDSIGGGKAFYINAELIFPVTPDMTIKGVVFYDGGAGWDNPYLTSRGSLQVNDDNEVIICPSLCDPTTKIPSQFVRNNNFSYRHSVGFGIRMLQPMPVRIDWGFKLDPRKGESKHEVHFSMNYGF
jgi:outer membrane protein assembly factor BamA